MTRNINSSQISASVCSSKVSTMARRRGTRTTLFFSLVSILAFLALIPVFAPLPSPSSPSFSHHHHHHRRSLHKDKARGFEIHDDMFWKDGQPFRIIGGDLHYFRVLPQQWEDRLLRAKALGLNTIQTYVPWNLHEPKPGKLVFEGIADLESFIKLCHKLDLLVMIRAGPYICAEWDLGGFPAWLLAIEPALKLRSSDPAYLHLVDQWWGILLPKLSPLIYNNGGPIIMVQVENEFGSYGNDKAYINHLVTYARGHLGDNAILYTTDGGSRELLEKGTIHGDAVFSAVDFTTGDDPWPIFKLQKEFNAPGKSPPISTEFYTGWLTHWGEKIASTDANFTASALEKILSRNGSAVLYMAHGGSNFGFYNGANTGADEYDYKPDLTSYDYDAPISETGDVANAKFNALRRVIGRYSAAPLPSLPAKINKRGYGSIQLHRTAFLFDLFPAINSAAVVESENPVFMESVGQMFGFLLYVSEYAAKDDRSSLFIPKVNDRAQVFTLCPLDDNGGRPTYVGVIERWKNSKVSLPNAKCASNISLLILVENMGRVNYGKFMFDRKGILSSAYLDGRILRRWKMITIPLPYLNEVPEINPLINIGNSRSITVSAHKKLEDNSKSVSNLSIEPTFYCGRFSIKNVSQVQDTFVSFSGWGKGIAFVNDFNIGRYWPSVGPQCNLYVPAPLLRHGENTLVVLELESPNPGLLVESVDKPRFTCGPSKSSTH